MTDSYVIAQSKIWDPEMSQKLSHATNSTFFEVNSESELSLENLGKMAPRIIFFPHWSSKIGKDIFENFECIVFHIFFHTGPRKLVRISLKTLSALCSI